MCPVGDKFPGEDGWTDFKAVRQEKLRETSPLVTILIYTILTLAAGTGGAVLGVLVVSRFAMRSSLRSVTGNVTQTVVAAAAVGFVLGAGWALKAILEGRRRSRGTEKRHDR